jgi:aryl-alcohol dehydrogenase-like predicted oxidoreductase
MRSPSPPKLSKPQPVGPCGPEVPEAHEVLTSELGPFVVSRVGLGCNNFGGRLDEDQTRRVVAAALDEGINFFDTADIYGGGASETFLGRALGGRRAEVIVASKFGLGAPPGASLAAIAAAVDASLARLGTDHIDLYQQHAPDLEVPVEDTLGALEDLVRAGKIRAFGCSNFDGRLLDEAVSAADRDGVGRYVSVQNELSLLRRRGERDVLAACGRHRIAFLPYFPLASGMLTGKYTRGEPPPVGTRLSSLPADRQDRALSDERFDVIDALTSFASERGHSLHELAMSWLASTPHIASVIAGATRPDQVRANAAAADWLLTEADRDAIDAISPPAEAVWGAAD